MARQTSVARAAAVSPAAAAAPKKKAASDDYTSEGVADNDVFLLPFSDFKMVAAITVMSALVRLFRIYQPSSVVFDEVHFGGFASKYIKGRFFMDVHPPLAKLLITLAGWMAGFDGDFDFKDIGKDYLEPGVPYMAMRLFPAVCGILLAPTMFLTLKASGCRSSTALMGAGMIIFENGLLTQARLILLDSPLMIATAFTGLSFTAFTNQHELGPSKAFEPSWWFWLLMTGLGLGITTSIKWVGFFTIAWVGLLTLVQLWVLLGDAKHVTIRLLAKHFMARVFCLIVVPVTFYMAMFGIHFLCLVNPGDGDGFMSSEFQATLNSKGMADTPADVLLGSAVTIRHVNTQGGYLHSHPLMYPTGSKQQQVTLYPHKDINNEWILENQTQPIGADGEAINGTDAWNIPPAEGAELPYIYNGMTLRIFHQATARRLHSHDVRPPVTEADWQNEVSAYGYEGFDGDANDYFRVEIVKQSSDGEVAKTRLRTIETKFQLVHIMTGCLLFSHKVKLPDWASEQQEVVCARGGSLPNSLWYVESNEHALLGPEAEKANYRQPGFFGKFLELQAVMWKTNAGLVESHAYESRPSSWPLLQRGINFWGQNHRQIYLVGNPFVWWSATAAVLTYVLFKGVAVLRWQRSCGDYTDVTFKRFDYEIGTSVLAWALHFFPFYLMQRQLFLHHYFPALYFGIMAFCQIYDYATARNQLLRPQEKTVINTGGAIGVLVLSAVVFSLFAPLAYGNAWTKEECRRVKLFDTWDWDCNTFLDTYEAYDTLTHVAAVPTTAVAAAAPVVAEPAVGEQEQEQEQVPMGDKAEVRAVPPPADISEAPSVPPAEKLLAKTLLSREQRVEYRDQDGNVLDEKQVEALRGKVEFKTRYETRTRLVDTDGNVVKDAVVDTVVDSGDVVGEEAVAEAVAVAETVAEAVAEPVAVAPPHPDVEGVDQSTRQTAAEEDQSQSVEPSVEGEREAEQSRARPASESNEATVGE